MSDSELSQFQIWLLAIRPKTLPAAIAPVLVGISFAIKDKSFVFLPALAALIGSLLLQILSNLANDYYDFLKGIDNAERQGPTRVAASGLLSIRNLKIGILVNIIIALLIGVYLIFVGGIPILLIGFFSILFALLYSGGPFPLSTIGLGDIFVFIFFGLIAVNGTYYVETLKLNGDVIWGSIPIGLLITAILVVNNYRDIETDKKADKFTIAVLFGHSLTRTYYLILIIISYLIPLYLLIFRHYNFLILLPVFSIYQAYLMLKNVYQGNEGKLMNMTLAGTAKLSLFYAILFSIGIALQGVI